MKCVVRTVSHNLTRMSVVWLVVSVWGCVCGAPTRGHIFTLCMRVCTTCNHRILCDSQLAISGSAYRLPPLYRAFIYNSLSPPGAPLPGGCARFFCTRPYEFLESGAKKSFFSFRIIRVFGENNLYL